MSIFVNVLCTLIGVIGTYAVMKIQRRDQQEDGMRRDLLGYVAEIDRKMREDIPAGGLSAELRALLDETDARIEGFCRSRWFRSRSNRQLREAWSDFHETITNAKIKKPVHSYAISQVSQPSDFGLDDKIRVLMRALI